MLVIRRKPGESLRISNATIWAVKGKGNACELSIDAPPHIRIQRSELGPPAEEIRCPQRFAFVDRNGEEWFGVCVFSRSLDTWYAMVFGWEETFVVFESDPWESLGDLLGTGSEVKSFTWIDNDNHWAG